MFEISFHVDYAETDAMQVVHHSNYLRWFERARVAWFRDQGFSYSEMERQNIYLPLRSARLDYLKPLAFDDKVRVCIKPKDIGKADITLEAWVYKESDLACHGETHHVFCRKSIDSQTGKERIVPTRIPKEWREKWLQLNEKKS